MIAVDDYAIIYYKYGNKIVITLPQTEETPLNTVLPVRNRKTEITEEELAVILLTVKSIFEGGENAASKTLDNQRAANP